MIQHLTHKVFEELKDTILWVRFANLNYLENFELDDSGAQKCPYSTRML